MFPYYEVLYTAKWLCFIYNNKRMSLPDEFQRDLVVAQACPNSTKISINRGPSGTLGACSRVNREGPRTLFSLTEIQYWPVPPAPTKWHRQPVLGYALG